MSDKWNKRMYPAVRSDRARVRCLLSHQHWPDIEELLEEDRHKNVEEKVSASWWYVHEHKTLRAKTQKDAVPSPLSCLVNQQSSGHSWGRLGLCTRLCETVAQCLSALQTPCWQTTAAARKQNTHTHTQQSCQALSSCSVNAAFVCSYQISRMKSQTLRVTSIKTCAG